MLPPEARRSEVVPGQVLPPVAPSWLRVAVSGTFSAAIFGVPGVLSLLAPVPLLIAYRRYGTRVGLAASVVGMVSTPILRSLASVGMVPEATAGELALPLGGGWLAFGLFAAAPAGILAGTLGKARSAVSGLTFGSLGYMALLVAVFAGVALLSRTAERRCGV